MNIKNLLFLSLLSMPLVAIGSEPSFLSRTFNWARDFIRADIDARVERLSGLTLSSDSELEHAVQQPSDPELDRAFQHYFDRVHAVGFFAERGFYQGHRAVFIYRDASKQEQLAMVLVTKENPQDIFPQITSQDVV